MPASRPEPEAPTREFPDFLIAGAPRCGTTSLYVHMQKHPQICMASIKEPLFFASAERRSPARKRTWSWYASLFDACAEGQIKGEATTHYFHYPESAELIRAAVPNAKIIILLRDPIDRVYSHYLHQARSRSLPPFEDLVRDRDERLEHYLNTSRYSTHIERFGALFDRPQLLVLLLEELETDPLRTVQRAYQFVGADPAFVPDGVSEVYNPSAQTRSQFVSRLKAKLVRWGLEHPRVHRLWNPAGRGPRRLDRKRIDASVPAELRRQLLPMVVDDVERLEKILERSFPSWKTV